MLLIGSDFEETCAKSCNKSCKLEVMSYQEEVKQLTGFQLEESAARRLIAACSKTCAKESLKPGQNRPFAVSYINPF